MAKSIYSFIETGWFFVTCLVVGFLVGLMIATKGFSLLATYEGSEVMVPIFAALLGTAGGGVVAWLVRKGSTGRKQ